MGRFHQRLQFSSVQLLSHVRLFVTPWTAAPPGLPVHYQIPELTQTHVHRVGDAIQPSHPLASPFPPAPNSSQHQGLFNESVLHIRRPKYWSFSFSISPSNEYSGLISFRMDWLSLHLVWPGCPADTALVCWPCKHFLTQVV